MAEEKNWLKKETVKESRKTYQDKKGQNKKTESEEEKKRATVY